MWFFDCILGGGFVCAFVILNAMWFEIHNDDNNHHPG